MPSIAVLFVGVPALLLVSVFLSRSAGRVGIPGLAIFLLVGVAAGALGLRGVATSNLGFAQTLGILALVFILHSGGLDTRTDDVRAVRASGLTLATVGVVISTALAGAFAVRVMRTDWTQGLLLGAIISATDVAAVFTILRSRSVSLRGRLGPLLELESALNDPMSVFLSVGLLGVISTGSGRSLWSLAPMFVQQMAIGSAAGWVAGKAMRWVINRAGLEFEGLYPVLSVALVVLTYGLTQAVGGSGFLAVYLSGIVLGNTTYVHKRGLTEFHDGLAWLMQVVMFMTMGLLVRPSELVGVAPAGIALSAFLVFVARPASVLATLSPFRFPLREQLMVAWAGLRGAVPIILATYPLIAGAPGARDIFNLVFFVVLISVVLQGTTVPAISRWLGVTAPLARAFRYPIEFTPTAGLKSDLAEVMVPEGSPAAGRSLGELTLPPGALVVLIRRKDEVLVPRGHTRIDAGDRLLVLAEPDALQSVRNLIG